MWSSPLRSAGLLLIVLALACSQQPVEWTSASAERISGDVDVSPTGEVTRITNAPLDTPLPSAFCPGSMRAARDGAVVNVVWWSPRADSTARLEFARSVDAGVHWAVHSTVDSTDRSMAGCRREPPAIAADAASGYIHVTYGLVSTEGPGLFFSHSMDNGALFHSPVPIMYGERLGRTAVAASGDNVAVAFEDPNSREPQIGLALSRTMGHIFEQRVLPVSADNGSATQPTVAVRKDRIAVAWREQSPSNTGSILRVRTGIIR